MNKMSSIVFLSALASCLLACSYSSGQGAYQIQTSDEKIDISEDQIVQQTISPDEKSDISQEQDENEIVSSDKINSPTDQEQTPASEVSQDIDLSQSPKPKSDDFGEMYYDWGSTLIYTGDYEEAYEKLKKAESCGIEGALENYNQKKTDIDNDCYPSVYDVMDEEDIDPAIISGEYKSIHDDNESEIHVTMYSSGENFPCGYITMIDDPAETKISISCVGNNTFIGLIDNDELIMEFSYEEDPDSPIVINPNDSFSFETNDHYSFKLFKNGEFVEEYTAYQYYIA